MMITQSELKQVLEYNPETGLFTWKKTVNTRAVIGSIAGWNINEGYIQISIYGKKYRAHRLAFLYMTGEWPKELVDHINQIKDDNRWSNLRQATVSENNINSKKQKNNKSGYRGVYWDSKNQMWRVQIKYKSKHRYLGRYVNIEHAAAAYKKVALELYGEFAETQQ
jgi:hypothetical protein